MYLTKPSQTSQAADGGLLSTLTNEGPFTVFAPTDNAFFKMGQDAFMQTIGNPSLVTQIIKYHIVPGLYPLDTLYSGSTPSFPPPRLLFL